METPETTYTDTEEPVELADYLRVLRERKWVVAAILLVVVAAALAFSLTRTPRYRATAVLTRDPNTLTNTLFGSRVFETQDVKRLLETSAQNVNIEAVALRVKDALDSPLSAEELGGMVEAVVATNADLVRVTATSTSADEAAALANSFAREYVAHQAESDKKAISLAIQVVEKQVNALTLSELASNRGVFLVQRLEELAVIEELQSGGFILTQLASVPTGPFDPQPLRDGILALAVGLVLGVGAAFLLEYLDRRIKDEETLTRELGLPVIAHVPRIGKKWAHPDDKRSTASVGFGSLDSPILEAFRTMRSNLQYFEVDRPLRTLLVTSALPQEGKTVTTINLGLSLALSGLRVLVVEADLRRPMVHRYLELGNDVGVSNVLAGTHSLAEAMQLVRVDDFSPSEARRSGRGHESEGGLLQKNMYCVTSGPLPPNPSELISSAKMAELLVKASEVADYVIVDSPPCLLVADALILAGHVDGVLISARMHHTTIDEAREMRKVLGRTNARLTGVVATGVVAGKGYHYRGYGYGSYPSRKD
ncbi:MAG: hypothetical protein KKA32_13580 [Actinobacteria bacterium]|nr:hypothetical protein [Actinomycetota bacterium]